MRISIFGAGYVGAVSAACFCKLGHEVEIIDINADKIRNIARGRAPIVEPGLDTLISQYVTSGQLRPTSDATQSILATDLSLICVGTPSLRNGDIDLSAVLNVTRAISEALVHKATRHTVIYRSTMLPGSMDNHVLPLLRNASPNLGAGPNLDLGVGIYPEFLRESSAIDDFFSPAITLFGVEDDTTYQELQKLVDGVKAPLVRTNLRTAESVKYTNNAWHAVKLTFANEIGNICKAAGIDGQEVMDILCQDRRLNISNAYLRPGYAFGGSCLPKDLRALRYKAASLGVESPLFDATMRANSIQIDRAFDMVAATGKRNVGMFGLAFKAGTDDLRESPLVELAERLLGKGFRLKIFDEHVAQARLVGANRDYIENKLAHLSDLMVPDMERVVSHSDVLVIGNANPKFARFGDAPKDKTIIDLIRVTPNVKSDGNYAGICW